VLLNHNRLCHPSWHDSCHTLKTKLERNLHETAIMMHCGIQRLEQLLNNPENSCRSSKS
jgi:hypothetical protein